MHCQLVGPSPYPRTFRLLLNLLEWRDVFLVSPIHRRANRRADGVHGAAQRVGIEMRVAVRRRGLRMPEQLSDDWKSKRRTRAE